MSGTMHTGYASSVSTRKNKGIYRPRNAPSLDVGESNHSQIESIALHAEINSDVYDSLAPHHAIPGRARMSAAFVVLSTMLVTTSVTIFMLVHLGVA